MIREPTLERYAYYLRRVEGDSGKSARDRRAAFEGELRALLAHVERLSGQTAPAWEWPEENKARIPSQFILRLTAAYDVILAIRSIARKYTASGSGFLNEYLPALFLYCLAMIKYYQDDVPQLTRLAFTTASVLGRYLATFDPLLSRIVPIRRTPCS